MGSIRPPESRLPASTESPPTQGRPKLFDVVLEMPRHEALEDGRDRQVATCRVQPAPAQFGLAQLGESAAIARDIRGDSIEQLAGGDGTVALDHRPQVAGVLHDDASVGCLTQ